MKIVKTLLGSAVVAGLLTTSALAENTFKFAFQGSLKSLDPYSLNETFTLGTLGNVYEGLTRRGPDLQIQPALAESWEIVEPTRWRFKLRQGVKFHNGNDFNADDVVFSAERLKSEGSDLKSRFPDGTKFEKVDDHTVDVVLTAPNPILHYEWDTWAIIDKEWAEANDSVKVTSASDQNASTISLEANGTGPFKLTSHEAGVKTTFEANADWWDAANKKLHGTVATRSRGNGKTYRVTLTREHDCDDDMIVDGLCSKRGKPVIKCEFTDAPSVGANGSGGGTWHAED